jgi:hypothetical protein
VVPAGLEISSRTWLNDTKFSVLPATAVASPSSADDGAAATAFLLAYSSLASSTSRFRRAIFLSRLSSSSSSDRSPSSSVPSWSMRCRRLEALYDLRLPSTRSEKSTPFVSTLAGRKRERASSMRRREREMGWVSSSTS